MVLSAHDDHLLDDFAQLVLHDFIRALCDSSYCHETCMPQPPVVTGEHAGDILKRRGKDRLPAQRAREAV